MPYHTQTHMNKTSDSLSCRLVSALSDLPDRADRVARPKLPRLPRHARSTRALCLAAPKDRRTGGRPAFSLIEDRRARF